MIPSGTGLGISISAGLLGIVFLILSADFVVSKLIRLARHYGLSNTFIGLTVLSVGTSLPEIASHLIASFGILTGGLDYRIASSTVLGANIGSDVVQQNLIMGLVIIMMGCVTLKKSLVLTAYLPMVLTALLCLVLGLDGMYSRLDGMILLGIFMWYMWSLYTHRESTKDKRKKLLKRPFSDVSLALAGLFVMLASSSLILESSEIVVTVTGIGGSLIGVMTLGVASALPELLTAINGIRKKAAGISFGTLIGSNIVNPLMGIGLGALISTYHVAGPIIAWDLPAKAVTAAIPLVWLVYWRKRLGKFWGAYFIAAYVIYIIIRIALFAVD